MYRLFHGMALAAAVLAGGLLTAAPALAEKPGVLRVEDHGKLFTADGVKAAERTIADVQFKSTTHFTVVTYSSIPSDRQAAFDKAKGNEDTRKAFFRDWTKEEARGLKEKGVFALIYGGGKNWWVDVETDRSTDVSRDFTAANSQELRKILDAGMKEGADAAKNGKTADDVKQLHDAALKRGAEFVVKELRHTSAPETGVAKQSAGTVRTERSSGGSGIMGYVCIGICVLLGVWLVVGLIRAFTGGGGGGGYGGGSGYGGGGYGGGGGGFMSSMIGGMFGAAAGMYMYDHFFGGHSSSSYGSDAAAGGYDNGGTTDTGAGDFDGGNSAGGGGGDWGDAGGDAGGGGGGDWGGDAGGGGDWGGGGDAGGGGDFGGGGGDW